MSLCLTREEITELTHTPQRKRQVEFLRKNGIRHYVDAYGWPSVTRAAVEGFEQTKEDRPAWKPNKAA